MAVSVTERVSSQRSSATSPRVSGTTNASFSFARSKYGYWPTPASRVPDGRSTRSATTRFASST